VEGAGGAAGDLDAKNAAADDSSHSICGGGALNVVDDNGGHGLLTRFEFQAELSHSIEYCGTRVVRMRAFGRTRIAE
jgi:hypothetical protein